MRTTNMQNIKQLASKIANDNPFVSEIEKLITDFINEREKWKSFNKDRPPYLKSLLVKEELNSEPIAAWLASNGNSDFWTICGTNIIIYKIKYWREI